MKLNVIEDIIHEGVSCSKCGIAQINGPRYRCFSCEDYNLCEICETASDSHSMTHAMIKIRKPDLDPIKNRDQVNYSNYYSSVQNSAYPQAD